MWKDKLSPNEYSCIPIKLFYKTSGDFGPEGTVFPSLPCGAKSSCLKFQNCTKFDYSIPVSRWCVSLSSRQEDLIFEMDISTSIPVIQSRELCILSPMWTNYILGSLGRAPTSMHEQTCYFLWSGWNRENT